MRTTRSQSSAKAGGKTAVRSAQPKIGFPPSIKKSAGQPRQTKNSQAAEAPIELSVSPAITKKVSSSKGKTARGSVRARADAKKVDSDSSSLAPSTSTTTTPSRTSDKDQARTEPTESVTVVAPKPVVEAVPAGALTREHFEEARHKLGKPGAVVCRTEEMAQIRTFLYDEEHTGGAMAVCGSSGTGKTATVEALLAELTGDEERRETPVKERTTVIQLNCHGLERNSVYKKILDRWPMTAAAKRTIAKKGSMETLLRRHFDMQEGPRVVVVLDEVDQLGDEIIKLYEWAAAKESRVKLIGIANKPRYVAKELERIEDKVQNVVYTAYKMKTIAEIIRARLGPHVSVFEGSAIQMCAGKVAKKGDIRDAFPCLSEAITLHLRSEELRLRDKSKEEDKEKAKKKETRTLSALGPSAVHESWLSVSAASAGAHASLPSAVMQLTFHPQIILSAVLMLGRNRSEKDGKEKKKKTGVDAKKVLYDEYCRLCEKLSLTKTDRLIYSDYIDVLSTHLQEWVCVTEPKRRGPGSSAGTGAGVGGGGGSVQVLMKHNEQALCAHLARSPVVAVLWNDSLTTIQL